MSMRKKEAAMIARMNAAQHSSSAAVPAPAPAPEPEPAAPEAEEVSRRQKAPIDMLKPSDCLSGDNTGTKSFPIRPYS